MNLLLDTCIWGGDWEKDPGDDESLARALREQDVLVTLDKDFGELAVVRRSPHRGILRLVGFAGREQGSVCVRVLAMHGGDLASGAIVTVDRRRIRVRPPDWKK